MLQLMSKDFDSWNKQKKKINGQRENRLYHEREIWWCSLGVNIGFEQDGTGQDYQRPVLILKGFSSHVCLVIPLTTSEKVNPFHFSLGMISGKKAFCITSQLRLLDTKRLTNKIAVLDKITFETIKKAVRKLF